jgi:hypothetical protein
MQVNIPDSFVYRSKKIGEDLVFDFTKLDKDIVERLTTDGLGRYFTDLHADASPKNYPDEAERKAAAKAAVLKKWDSLLKGEMRAPKESSIDPVEAEAKRLGIVQAKADEGFRAWLVEQKLVATKDDGLKAFVALAKQYAADPDIIAQAKANVEKVTALPKIKIDFGSLLKA